MVLGCAARGMVWLSRKKVAMAETRPESTELPVVHVAAGIIRSGSKIFATARGYGDWQGWWEFPGGKIEPGETAQEALVRELHEELAVAVTVGEYAGLIEYDYPTFHLHMDCYWAELKPGEHPKLLEHEAARWLEIGELDSVKWLPADVEFIRELQSRGFGDAR